MPKPMRKWEEAGLRDEVFQAIQKVSISIEPFFVFLDSVV